MIGRFLRISDMGPRADGHSSLGAYRPQVIYSRSSGEYLVVWHGVDEPFGTGESEIWAQRIDGASGSEVGANDFRLSRMGPDGNTAYDAYDPAVALNLASGETLVVWRGEEETDEDTEIWGQLYLPGLFEDDFEDQEIAPEWTLPRGLWSEDLGVLTSLSQAAVSGPVAGGLATGFGGCAVLEVGYDGARFRVTLDGELLFDEPSAFAGEPFGTVGFGARSAEVEVEGIFVVDGTGEAESAE